MTEHWYVTISRDGTRTVHLEVRFGPERGHLALARCVSFHDLQALGADAVLRHLVPLMRYRIAECLKEQETQ